MTTHAKTAKNPIHARLCQSICDIRETGRISEVEKRALLELAYDLVAPTKQAGAQQLTHEEAILVNRVRALVSLDDSKPTWVEAVVMAAKEQGYEVPKDLLLSGISIASLRKIESELLGSSLGQIDIDKILADIRGLKDRSGTLDVVQHILGAFSTRNDIIAALDQLKADLTVGKHERDELRADLARERKELESCTDALGAGQRIIDTARETIKSMETTIDGKDIEINRLREEVTDKQDQIEGLAKTVSWLDGKVKGQTATTERLYYIITDHYKGDGKYLGLQDGYGFTEERGKWTKFALIDASRKLISTAGRGFVVVLEEVKP